MREKWMRSARLHYCKHECISHGNSASQAIGTHCDDVLIKCAIDNDCAERKWFEKIIKVFVNARTHQCDVDHLLLQRWQQRSRQPSRHQPLMILRFADEFPLEMLVNLWHGVDCVTGLRRHSQITFLWRKVKVNERFSTSKKTTMYFGFLRGTQSMLTMLCFFLFIAILMFFYWRKIKLNDARSTFPQNRSEPLRKSQRPGGVESCTIHNALWPLSTVGTRICNRIHLFRNWTENKTKIEH